ncbi:MAG: hypothetical protein A2233_05085 [Candidatus Kerfeldbacteria bacterium RIFOXYA2_FULL_38_24]|uniref:Thioredoxin domain-containing protein n=1 Tax=Candidatus Kerfeldbacteria bacterium RIFOXYB2_FULL_38_14 TaxID=1798547 RepID=A0A1G2BJJ0_9BACT|nr:MAG: hypothetical protein A2233_05085 [Candidatus Kerfeldbacteria bacterium RIFOXYA2_FULL_38_24]OGY88397.1 MAG: hypothetical protein A2319_05165 [Candidatus Kerfeldbacteria bacterium RIFOXYB2_FULL_38_14]OGY89082.1 MAG: hypothetical protein A2458_00735 [Candidatus Kerfeldbacteria bacterium RIFOXYC2_FULL_38_9]
MSEEHKQPAIEIKASWTHTSKGIIILIILILLLLLLGFFVKRAYTYYQQVKFGTIDLSKIAQNNNLSASDFNQKIPTISNAYVDGFTDDPILGPKSSKLTVVLFEDFQCPFCASFAPDLRAVMNKYSDRVRFVYRDFPVVASHPQAQIAAEAGQCANEQDQFWAYHDLLYNNQDKLTVENLKSYAQNLGLDTKKFNNCLESQQFAAEVEQDLSDGITAGVTGTPTMFFNGNKVEGVLTLSGLERVIDHFLNQ